MNGANPTFYATVAAVLPVLLIVLAIEYRLFQEREREPVGESLFLLGVVFLIVGGELVALFALYGDENQPSPISSATVIGAVSISLLAVSLPLTRPRFAALRYRLGHHARWVGPVLFVLFLAAVGLAAVGLFDPLEAFAALALALFAVGAVLGTFTARSPDAGTTERTTEGRESGNAFAALVLVVFLVGAFMRKREARQHGDRETR